MTFKTNSNYQKLSSTDFKVKQKPHSKGNWWTPLWNGLPSSKHYKIMWLYLYFLTHANRYSGILFRKTSTISKDMGLNKRTVSRWISILKQNGYIEIRQTGHSLEITITKWKSIKK
jgi:DNA-binding transcriptional ArsR family regulator